MLKNDENYPWEFPADNPTQIKFTSTVPLPKAGDSEQCNLLVSRETSLEKMEAYFYPGASIKADDLNDNFDQLRRAIDEGRCFAPDWFFHYLDEYIWDKRDAYTTEDQQNGLAVPSDDKIFTSGGIAAGMTPIYKMAKPTEPPYEQGGKRWYDTESSANYMWNDQIGAWIDYARTGPQGPRGLMVTTKY